MSPQGHRSLSVCIPEIPFFYGNFFRDRKPPLLEATEAISNCLNRLYVALPQGSILGPLLFLLYINDLAQASRILKPITFADDTNLFYAHENINILFQNVNIELQNLCDWFSVNKLSLNNDKRNTRFSINQALVITSLLNCHLFISIIK